MDHRIPVRRPDQVIVNKKKKKKEPAKRWILPSRPTTE